MRNFENIHTKKGKPGVLTNIKLSNMIRTIQTRKWNLFKHTGKQAEVQENE